MFEQVAIEVIQACSSVSAASKLLGLDWDAVKQDLKWCGLIRSEVVVPFSGRSNRLADAVTGNRVVNL